MLAGELVAGRAHRLGAPDGIGGARRSRSCRRGLGGRVMIHGRMVHRRMIGLCRGFGGSWRGIVMLVLGQRGSGAGEKREGEQSFHARASGKATVTTCIMPACMW